MRSVIDLILPRRPNFAMFIACVFWLCCQSLAHAKAPGVSGQSWLTRFEPIVEPYQQIFPAFEIASQNLPKSPSAADPLVFGDGDALIGASVESTVANVALTLVISADALLLPSRIEVKLPRAKRRYTLYPSLQWRPNALLTVRKERTVKMRFELFSGGTQIADRVVDVRLRPTNEVLYGVRDQLTSKVLDFNWLFAAFVDDRSPAVAEILRLSKRTGVIQSFQGYQAQDDEEVYAQVFAIWHVLQSRGIRYSNLPSPPKTRALIYSQYVRFVAETWRSQKANCVDGSVLIASVLERAGLKPVLVILPGHMLLGFALDAEGTRYGYLETTRLGDLPRGVHRPALLSMQQSFAIFEKALRDGEKQVAAAGSAFEDPDDLSYQLMDVAFARKLGVMPIRPESHGLKAN